MKKKFFALYLLVAVMGVVVSCSKSETDDTANLRLLLTDAQGQYDEVNIDIVGVEVIINDSIIELDAANGVYNLLEFTNGKDTILVDQSIPAGTLSQLRLILGENNTVKIDGELIELITPSSQQSGLKFNIHQNFMPELAYEYIIDFDAGKSIVGTGNEEYILKPVISVFSEAVSGAIKGTVFPANAKALIYAISSESDSSSTFADSITGNYMFRGLYQDNYNLVFLPDTNQYVDTTLENIQVNTGQITVVDTVNFREKLD